jgi:hypothetical protein
VFGVWEALAKCKMECRFSVEAKTFSFSAHTGKSVLRLEEKRKGFSGFISLGIKFLEWLAVVVEEALGTQRKEDFARSFCDEVRVVKIQMGSNKAGYFLEAAVFIEGARKGGPWRLGLAKIRGRAPFSNCATSSEGFAGSPRCQCRSGQQSAFLCGCSCRTTVRCKVVLRGVSGSYGGQLCFGRVLSMGGGSCLTEVLRSLAMELLAKVRAEVDRVIFFGLGLKINTLTDIRRRLGRVFSRLGLKPKLLHGFNLKGRHTRLTMRGLNLGPAVALVKANGGGEWILDSDLGQGKVSSEKTEEEAVLLTSGGDDVVMGSRVAGFDEAVASSGKGVVSPLAKSMLRRRFLRPGSSSLPEEEAELALGSSESSFLDEVPGKVATRVPSSEKGMLRQGFLLR